MKNKIVSKLTDLIGNTPMMRLNNYIEEQGCEADILAKLESFNPLGSAKDRLGYYVIKKNLEMGEINKDTVIIEPTSGNTGIAIAYVAAAFRMKAILTMPETMSVERISLLKALGAEVILTSGEEGMNGAIEKAKELASETENSFIPQQFENPDNPEIHRLTTAEEIWSDTDGIVDIFISGVGTGGTLTGVGQVLKERNPNVKIIAVEPFDCPVLSKGRAGSHKLQGIGAGFIPKVLKVDLIDEVFTVKTEEAYEASRLAAKAEGLLVGITSGAALHAATVLSKRKENKGKVIVVIMPDTGERYLSTQLYFD